MRSAALLLSGVLTLSAAAPGLADSAQLDLPTPEAALAQQNDLIIALGGRPDRLLASDVPGPVVNDEVVRVGLAGDGGVTAVTADQRLQLTGEGDYAVRERGPARSATSLGSERPPITRLGAVVWQGFSPGRRDLAARLVLDPQIERPHLPLSVQVSFTGADGVARALAPGGAIPSAGTTTVTVTNVTSQPQVLPTAVDAPASALAPLLDRAVAVSRRPSAARLPSTDLGLPPAVPATGVARVQASQAVPLRLTGALTVAGTTATVEGPSTTPAPGGATFAGTLGGSLPTDTPASVSFTVRTTGPGELTLDLRAAGALNPAEVAPPDGFATWAAWAGAAPPQAQRKQALDLLVAVAATGARASSYAPYLGADLKGTGSTRFVYGFAAPPEQVAVARALTPRWGPLGLTGLAVLVLLAQGAVLWRQA